MSVVEFLVADGDGVVRVQALPDGPDEGLARAGTGERMARMASASWDQALDGVHAAAEGMLRQVRRIDPPPNEATLAFGVAISGTLGATLVSTGADAHISVTVTWHDLPAPGPDAGGGAEG